MEADLTPEERALVESIPAAVIPPCETKLFQWSKWSMFHFFSSVINKIEGAIHSLGEMAGIWSDHEGQASPSSWGEILEEVRDLPGLEVIFNMAITLTNKEENSYSQYYSDKTTKIAGKGISRWSIKLKEEEVKPFVV